MDLTQSLDPFAVGIPRDSATRSPDWDEIRTWSDTVYMPYRVRPTGRVVRPSSSMFSAAIAQITLTRFRYGIPVAVDRFSPEAGKILVLNTVRGLGLHQTAAGPVEVGPGGCFVVDCSRIEHRSDFDHEDLQLNLTIPHTLVADLAERWFGFLPDDRLWRHRCVVGGGESGWTKLLAYAVQSVLADPAGLAHGRPGIHLQDMLIGHLLTEWATSAGVPLDGSDRQATPGYVRRAEQYFDEHAGQLPTVSEVAAAVGVSVRALSGGFRRYRGTTPSRYLRDVRLNRIRDELVAAGPGATVSEVAARWGYVNLGVFAASYRRRFGENPSQTLARGD